MIFFPLLEKKKKWGGWLRFELLVVQKQRLFNKGRIIAVLLYLPSSFLTTNALANDIFFSGWFFSQNLFEQRAKFQFFWGKKVFHFCFFGVKKYCMKILFGFLWNFLISLYFKRKNIMSPYGFRLTMIQVLTLLILGMFCLI